VAYQKPSRALGQLVCRSVRGVDGEALKSAVRALDSAADERARAQGVEPGDLYRWGGALSTLTDRLDAVSAMVAAEVGRLEGEAALRDDTGGDPWQRLRDARGQLEELRAALTAANGAARRFHSSVGHVGRALAG